MKIALIAHDNKKQIMLHFIKQNIENFKRHELYGTGTTGKMIADNTGLEVYCFKSGPLGGDQQVGAKVSNGKIDMIFFFRDPLTAHPHEPDVTALLRLADIYEIPLATNVETAKYLANDL